MRSTRRDFLHYSAALLAAAPATSALLAPGDLKAIEPIARAGGSKFKFSLAAYSYRDLLSGKSPKLTLEDFITEYSDRFVTTCRLAAGNKERGDELAARIVVGVGEQGLHRHLHEVRVAVERVAVGEGELGAFDLEVDEVRPGWVEPVEV